ncbi:GAF domain-related protein, putative [Plasmodium relictum]|uniref:GAF domain-related protein, putative n=1 Tax=Plasmodium relictum TaxID=85471 RepID=A0A1J1H1D4_PLARL|nr:GAF domain-related protein, putative [Plasmodium relictum]CRG98736.1 GAF domain-related protein, putative [Plasmodium relictum]
MNERVLKVIWGCDTSWLLIKKNYNLKLFSLIKFHYCNLLHDKRIFVSRKRSNTIYMKNEKKSKQNYKTRNDDLKSIGSNEKRSLTRNFRGNLIEDINVHCRNNAFNKLYCDYYSTEKDYSYMKENFKGDKELKKKAIDLISDSDKKIEKIEEVGLNKGDNIKVDILERKKYLFNDTSDSKYDKKYQKTEGHDNLKRVLINYNNDLEMKYSNSKKDENYRISKVSNSDKNENNKEGKYDNLNNNGNDKIDYVNNQNGNYCAEIVKENKENCKLKKKNEIKKVLNIIFCSSIPMIGFGFMDQFIMIRLGDIFDASIGVSFGISTLCAASFGQLCSDTFGIFFGYVLNYLLQTYKVIEPAKYDIKNKVYQYCTLIGSVLGILLGCSIGMLQLIFIDTSKSERLKKKKELDFIFQMVMCDCPNILNCETSTLFLYDKAKNELWSKAIHGRKNIIKIPVNSNEKSFNLWVLRNKEIINCKNVLNNELYNPSHDKKFNFKTRTILAAPILDKNNEVVGVLMFLNKLRSHGGYFTRNDEKLAEMMSKHISIFMEKFNYISEGDKKMIIFDQEKNNTQEEDQDEDEGDEVDTNLSNSNFQKEKKEMEEMKTKNLEDEKKKKKKRKRKKKIIQQNISHIEEDEKIFDEGNENEKEKEFDEEYYDEKNDDADVYDDEDEDDDEDDDEDEVEDDDEKLNKLKEIEIEKEKNKINEYKLNQLESEGKNGFKLDIEDKLNKKEEIIEKNDEKLYDFLIENYFINNGDNNNDNNDSNNMSTTNSSNNSKYKSDECYNGSNKEYNSRMYHVNGKHEKIYDINNIDCEKDIIKYMNHNLRDKFSTTNINKNSNDDALKEETISYNSKKEKILLEDLSNNNINVVIVDKNINNDNKYNNGDNIDYKFNNNFNDDRICTEIKSLNSKIPKNSDINEYNRYLNSYIIYVMKNIDEFFKNIKKNVFFFKIQSYKENINLCELYKMNRNSDNIFEKVNFENNIDNNTIQEKENMEKFGAIREEYLIRNEIDFPKNDSNYIKKKASENENMEAKKCMNNNYKPFLNEIFYNNSSLEIIKKINKEVIKNYLKNSQQIEKLLFKKKIMLNDVVKFYSSNMFDEKYFSHVHLKRVFNNVFKKKIDIKNFKMLKNIFKYNLNRIFSNTNKYMIIKKRKKLRKFCYTIKVFDIHENNNFWFTIYCQNIVKKTFYKNLNLIINLHNSCIIDLKLIHNYLLSKIYENTSFNYIVPNICYNIKKIDFFFKENLYHLNNSNMCDIIYKYIIFYHCRKKVKRKNFNYYNYQDLFIEDFFDQNTHTKKVPKILNDDLGKKSEIITIDR